MKYSTIIKELFDVLKPHESCKELLFCNGCKYLPICKVKENIGNITSVLSKYYCDSKKDCELKQKIKSIENER